MGDTILVVDDSEVMRSMVKIFLSGLKFAVVEAENGARGLMEAKKHQPAVILTDFNMPVMDGLELVRLVRADAELRRTLIIMLTDSKYPDLPSRAQEMGVNRLLPKSVGGPEVARAVAAFLREQQELNARRAAPASSAR
jgi:two-component system chemotaxis response regulator CheY